MEKCLSDFLIEQIKLFDLNGVEAPTKEEQYARFFLTRIAEVLVGAREAFTGDQFAVLEQAVQNEPEIMTAEIDRVLTKQVLDGIHSMVERIVSLSRLSSTNIPSKQTATYIREAAQTYY